MCAALAAFNTTASSCTTADDQQDKLAAWELFAAATATALQLVTERIRRQQAEVAVVLRDSVQRAKACALDAFDQHGLLQAMACCDSTAAAAKAYEVQECFN
jgi:hypothetical protein